MRIVFFGTPEFAVPSLRLILSAPNAFQVTGVVTQPDRPRGRSRSTLVPPPVKVTALEAGLPVLQPERPVGDVFRKQLQHFQADIGVVVAYGHILRPDVLALPPKGMVNLHASLLPRHRGAAPINWAILAGDAVTGVSVMQMEEGLDSGPVYRTAETPIEPMETAGALTERLAQLGAQTLLDTLTFLRLSAVEGIPQDGAGVTLAPKISRDLARIRWTDDAAAIARKVRAFDPVPGAWATVDDVEVKLFGAVPVPGHGEAGTVVPVEGALVVVAGGGAVRFEEVQPAGRSRMGVAAWLRGRHGRPLPKFG